MNTHYTRRTVSIIFALAALSLSACAPTTIAGPSFEGDGGTRTGDASVTDATDAVEDARLDVRVVVEAATPTPKPPTPAPTTDEVCGLPGDACDVDVAPCCSLSMCISYQQSTWCADTCTSNSQCKSGCCAPLSNSTKRVCSAASFCE